MRGYQPLTPLGFLVGPNGAGKTTLLNLIDPTPVVGPGGGPPHLATSERSDLPGHCEYVFELVSEVLDASL
jgi:hypothetical protein